MFPPMLTLQEIDDILAAHQEKQKRTGPYWIDSAGTKYYKRLNAIEAGHFPTKSKRYLPPELDVVAYRA